MAGKVEREAVVLALFMQGEEWVAASLLAPPLPSPTVILSPGVFALVKLEKVSLDLALPWAPSSLLWPLEAVCSWDEEKGTLPRAPLGISNPSTQSGASHLPAGG